MLGRLKRLRRGVPRGSPRRCPWGVLGGVPGGVSLGFRVPFGCSWDLPWGALFWAPLGALERSWRCLGALRCPWTFFGARGCFRPLFGTLGRSWIVVVALRCSLPYCCLHTDKTVKAHGFSDELSASLSVFRTRQIGTHSHSVSVCVPPSEALCLEGIVFR